jgi:heme-degrading monooxygenase HmoA
VIARLWCGTATESNAVAYVAHLRSRTIPELARIPGHRGAYVLQRSTPSGVAFTVITLWDSLDAIRQFAGSDPELAVVPAEARALLASYDPRAVHWEVALDNPRVGGAK